MSDPKDLDDVRRLERVIEQLTEHLRIVWGGVNQNNKDILDTMLQIARDPQGREALKKKLLSN